MHNLNSVNVISVRHLPLAGLSDDIPCVDGLGSSMILNSNFFYPEWSYFAPIGYKAHRRPSSQSQKTALKRGIVYTLQSFSRPEKLRKW